MKNILLTSIFTLIALFTFAQNKPQFVIEQSAQGYDVFLVLDNFSNLSNITIEGFLQKDDLREILNLDLSIKDLKSKKPFTSFGNDDIKAGFIVVITDANGTVTRYPSIDLNLSKG